MTTADYFLNPADAYLKFDEDIEQRIKGLADELCLPSGSHYPYNIDNTMQALAEIDLACNFNLCAVLLAALERPTDEANGMAINAMAEYLRGYWRNEAIKSAANTYRP